MTLVGDDAVRWLRGGQFNPTLDLLASGGDP